jgi:hypothetical protein
VPFHSYFKLWITGKRNKLFLNKTKHITECAPYIGYIVWNNRMPFIQKDRHNSYHNDSQQCCDVFRLLRTFEVCTS